jgi:hypothetical protein
MDSLNECILEYTRQLDRGLIQKAYKGIMEFMSELSSDLERRYPDYSVSALYFGYMDMTYFAFTPPELKKMKLKIAIVFLHQEHRFELWLAGNNRAVQAEYIERLSHKDLGGYKLSKAEPGVDSILETRIAEHPDFDALEGLKNQIEEKAMDFVNVISSIL